MKPTSSVTNTPDDLSAGRKFTFHHDAGHGWLEVNRADLAELNIATEISPFSYQSGNKVYLEEDCDMPTFVRAYEERFGVSVTTDNLANNVYEGDDSHIRGYSSYRP